MNETCSADGTRNISLMGREVWNPLWCHCAQVSAHQTCVGTRHISVRCGLGCMPMVHCDFQFEEEGIIIFTAIPVWFSIAISAGMCDLLMLSLFWAFISKADNLFMLIIVLIVCFRMMIYYCYFLSSLLSTHYTFFCYFYYLFLSLWLIN